VTLQGIDSAVNLRFLVDEDIILCFTHEVRCAATYGGYTVLRIRGFMHVHDRGRRRRRRRYLS